MNKKLQISVMALFMLPLLQACTDANEKSSALVQVTIPALTTPQLALAAPGQTSDFDCVVLNVTGSGIDRDSGLGVISTMVAASTGGTLKVQVPAGAARLFQIVGVESSNGNCPSEITRAGLLSTTSFPVLSELGRETADISGDTSLVIRGNYNASVATDVRTGNLLDGGSGGGGGGGASPTPTPSPTPSSYCGSSALGSQFAGGSGTTSSDPYLIGTVAQWNLIGNSGLNLRNCHFRLTQNLNFAGGTISQIRALDGSIDGNNKTLSNGLLSYTSESGFDNVGLIDIMGSYGSVKDLTTDGLNFTNASAPTNAVGRIGTIAARINSAFATTVAITNVTVKNSTLVYDSTWNPASLAHHSGGGLIGDMTRLSVSDITVQNVDLTMPASASAGGIVGKIVVAGTVSGSLVDDFRVLRNNSTVGNYAYGGLVGYAEEGTIEDSLVKNSSLVDVTANKPRLSYGAGGAVGVLKGTLRRTAVESTTLEIGSNVGGLVGAMLGNGYIEDSYARTTISNSNMVAGGVVGYLNTSASGDRVVRAHSMSVVNPYDSVDGQHGFVGEANVTGRIVNSFWNNDGAVGGPDGGDVASTGLSGATAAGMIDQATFTGWDFSGTGPWMITTGDYPKLRSLSSKY